MYYCQENYTITQRRRRDRLSAGPPRSSGLINVQQGRVPISASDCNLTDAWIVTPANSSTGSHRISKRNIFAPFLMLLHIAPRKAQSIHDGNNDRDRSQPLL